MEETFGEAEIRSLFGKNLKRLRALYNLSQIALAGQADLTHNFINDIESGKKWVSSETLAKLSTALQAEPYQFFLPEASSQENTGNIFSIYLDDFSDNLQKMVGELKHHYIHDVDGETAKSSGS